MDADSRFRRSGRGLSAISLGLILAAVFELVTVLATQDMAIRAVSPWQDDPYDVAVSLTQFTVPALAVVIGLRLLVWTEPGREDREPQMLRAVAVLAGLVGLAAGAEWAAVAVGAHQAAWTSGTALLIAGLAVVSVLAVAEAVVVVPALRRAATGRQWQHDWLGDVVLVCARLPVARLWVTERRAASVRRHATLMFSALSVLAGAAEITVMAIRERWADPLLISWAVVVAAAGNIAFCLISNAMTGFITRPPRGRAQRVTEAALMAGSVALLIAVAFRADIWRLGSRHPLSAVVPLVVLTLGAGLAAALVAAAVAFFRPSATDRPAKSLRTLHLSDPLYALYTRRLRRQVLADGQLPRHVGLVMDGNRRWARQAGLASPSLGHRYGAEHAEDLLAWCETLGIQHVTVFVCSTENLARRDDAEVAFLMQVIEDVIATRLGRSDEGWRVRVAGALDMLPDSTARALKQVVESTRDCATGFQVTLAIGYGGRQEVVDAIREALAEYAARGRTLADAASCLDIEDVARHLYTAGLPDPDLVIRTSGEQRMSNFLLWQSAYAELYFCDAYWPAFREIDFLRALRSYASRQRRYGA